MTNKINAGRFFEDFTLNEVIEHATPRTITAGDCALYLALYGARQPLFCSAPPSLQKYAFGPDKDSRPALRYRIFH